VITLNQPKQGPSLKDAVKQLSGVDLGVCLQCRKCSSGCPVAKLTQRRPSELVRDLRLGAGLELLESDLLGTCVSCETCSARCPMGVDVAAVIDALRGLALRHGASAGRGDARLFNRAFLRTVQAFGRTYEMGMIAAYKLGSGKWKNDVEKFPSLLRKGKIALLPPRGADRKTVRRIFQKTRRNKGPQA
jgi:heterodisulfide reductase subunit C